jgi:ABC-2 type transport system ATP-binding protein
MLKINNLKVSYGDHQVLKNLNLECLPGEIHGLLGMNGAGKTTLFRALYGFIKKDAGTCQLEGQSITSRSIAFLETSPFFYSYMKGKEYLDIVSLNKDFNVEKWNSLFDLPLDDLIDTYSTGMKKKLALLGVISLKRPVMILDEPFSGVDIESNEKIFQILQRLKEQKKVILLSSHILQSFTGICDKISVMKTGEIEKTFSKQEFPVLESELKEEINKGMGSVLDELMEEK